MKPWGRASPAQPPPSPTAEPTCRSKGYRNGHSFSQVGITGYRAKLTDTYTALTTCRSLQCTLYMQCLGAFPGRPCCMNTTTTHTRTLRLRAAEPLARVHSAGKWQRQAPVSLPEGPWRTGNAQTSRQDCGPRSPLPREPRSAPARPRGHRTGALAPRPLGVATWLHSRQSHSSQGSGSGNSM